jgi:hypothetical protein
MDCLDRSLLGILKDPISIVLCIATQTPFGTSQSLSDMIAWIAEEPMVKSLPRLLPAELAVAWLRESCSFTPCHE